MSGLATRLYRGEAGLDIVGRRRMWFAVAGTVMIIALLSIFGIGFKAGIEFEGGNEIQVPSTVGTLTEVEGSVTAAVEQAASGTEVGASQRIGNEADGVYSIRTATMTPDQTDEVRRIVAQEYGLTVEQIGNNEVSAAWGEQITRQALLGLVLFVVAVSIYLIIRFEWRMAVAAVASLLFDLAAAAAVYALVGFEVTPSTVIGFLTILGFALYDVVVVFDKVQENTRGITGSSTRTYAEAANLALNQTFMRSINTSLVALLPVGGLLFIGAGLLGAGTLKDLGLVLFIGMGTAVYSSLFFATPVLVWLKEMDPKIANHTKRVLARRRSSVPAGSADDAPATRSTSAAATAPKVGVKPNRGGKVARPAGAKRH